MKNSYLLLLTVAAGSAYASPAITDSSYGSNGAYVVYGAVPTTAVAPAQSNLIIDALTNLQAEVLQLKSKVAELKGRQDKMESISWGTPNPNYGKQAASLPSSSLIKPDASLGIVGDKNHYDYAYSLFRNGAYDQAIAQFQSLIKTYPKSQYADNSQYWTGEALLKMGNRADALRAFDQVVYAYPKSAKVPDALLKLGMTLANSGNKSKAKEYYDYLISAYPGTPSGTAAVVKRAALQ